MKLKTLLPLLLCCLTLSVNAQEVKQEIAREFMAYQNAIIDKDFEKSLEYITPDFFEIYPKSEVLKLMQQTFNDPSINYEIKNTEITNIDDIQKIEEKHYALITYSSQMNIKFNAEEEEESEEDKKSRTGMYRIYLEQAFGSNNVAYNPATEQFEVKAQKNVYAISKNGKTDWKFLMVEKEQKVVMDKLLPAELANKI